MKNFYVPGFDVILLHVCTMPSASIWRVKVMLCSLLAVNIIRERE